MFNKFQHLNSERMQFIFKMRQQEKKKKIKNNKEILYKILQIVENNT